jgi:SAM-dependent methyltransferase
LPERPSEQYYNDTARFYEQFVTRPDEPFFREMAKRYGSPILELASGIGRISLMLAEAGYEVVGVELTPRMMEIANRNLQKLPESVQHRVTFLRGDITDFKLDQKFSLILIPSSFKFLLTTDDQLACLECVRNHLQEDGGFILDFHLGEAFEEDGTYTYTHVESDGTTIKKMSKFSNDLNTQLRHWDVVIEVTHPNGEVEKTETQVVTALFMPRESDLLAKQAGFQVIEEYGDWDFSPYTSGSRRRILILQKER